MITKEIKRLTIRFEEWWHDPKEKPTLMVSVYNEFNEYVGSLENAKTLLGKYFIIPEKSSIDHCVCSIGKSLKDSKWYGWSHRAIHGFSIGDVVKEGDCCASPGVTDEYLKDHPEADLSLPVGFVAKTEEDCKRMAISFADSVS